MWLVIGDIHDGDAVGFEAISEGERRVVQVLRDNAGPGDGELALDEVVKPDGGVELLEGDRKVRVLHLARERRFELLPSAEIGRAACREVDWSWVVRRDLLRS